MEKKGNILVVDDTHESLALLNKLLSQEGYTVYSADSGELALASINKIIPDIILLDVRMPGIDGFEVCRILKSKPEVKDIPVIFLTAATDKNDRVYGLKLGAVDYIIKPFEKEELIARVKTHFDLYAYHKLFKEQTAEQMIEKERLLRIQNAEYQKLNIELIERNNLIQSSNEELRQANQQLNSVRKIAEESEFRFSKLYESGSFGMAIVDDEFRFVKANPAYCSIMGYSENELTKMTFSELSHPDDLKKDLPNVRKLIRKEIAVYKTEKRYIRKDGQAIWGSLTTTAIYDSEGCFLYNLAIVEDITSRKQAEEEVLRLNERIATATRSARVGIWDWDVQQNQLLWDDQMYALYGLERGAFNGAYEAWMNGLHPDDKEFCHNESQLALLGKKDYDTEFRLVWPDGTVRYIKAKGEVFRDENGEPVRMVGINYDVTEQKKTEEKIREKDGEFRKLSANVPGLIFQFTRKPDGSYCVPIASKGIWNIFGCLPEDVVDDFGPIGRVIYPEDAERVIQDIEYSAKYLTYFTCEFRVQIPGRDIQWIYSRSSPERLPDGCVTWYGFNTDITHIKLAEEKIKLSEHRLDAVLNGVTESIMLMTLEGIVLTANKTAADRWGMTIDKIIGYNGFNYHNIDHKKKRELQIQEMITARSSIQFEEQWGETSYDLTFYPIIESNGEITQFAVFTRDITEQKKAQESLRISEEKLRTIFDVLPVGISLIDNNRSIAQMNKVLEQITRLSYDDITAGKHKRRKYLKSDGSEMPPYELASTRAIEENKIIQNIETGIQTENGSVFWTSVSAAPLNVEGLSAVVITIDINDRKRAEEALQQSENLLRSIMDNTSDIVFVKDKHCRFVYINPAGCELNGKSVDQLIGYSKADFLTDKVVAAKFLVDDMRIIKSGRSETFEEEVMDADGTSHVFLTTKFPRYDGHGNIIGLIGVAHDITERKRAEKTLYESEEKFRKAFSINPDSITITRLEDGIYISVNKGFTRIYGYSEEEILGKSSMEINMWFNLKYRTEFVRLLKTDGSVVNFETKLFTKQGEIKDSLVSAVIIEIDEIPYILSTTRDITERKKIEEALYESEEKFRSLIESIPLPVAYSSETGEILFRNERFLQVIGYTHADVPTINEWWLRAYPDESYRNWAMARWESAVLKAVENGTDIESDEYRIVCKNGQERIIIITGITISTNLLVTFIDVTERKKAEQEVRKLNETLEQRVIDRTSQLEAANKELEAFSYSVSHDLRAPLRHINGYVDLLNDRFRENLPEKAQHYMATISDSAKQMGMLIDDLLQFSRTGRQELNKTKFDMNVLLSEVLEKIEPDTRNRKITWSVQKLPEVFGDLSMLKQVWINLIDNAVKYTRNIERPEISIQFREEKSNFVFIIRDNGVGFDMKYANKLFGVFQRLHSQAEFEGTGIGLANVQRIVLKHNGKVWAEAEPNKGAIFYFSIPK